MDFKKKNIKRGYSKKYENCIYSSVSFIHTTTVTWNAHLKLSNSASSTGKLLYIFIGSVFSDWLIHMCTINEEKNCNM